MAAALSFVLVSATPANIPLPTLFGLQVPILAAVWTFGVAFALIVLMEAFVLSRSLSIDFQQAAALTLTANLLTAAWGVLAFQNTLFFFGLIITTTLLATRLAKWKELAIWKRALAPVLFVATAVSWLGFSGDKGVYDWVIYLSLVPAFVMTTILEWWWLLSRAPTLKRLFRAVVFANVASYLLLGVGFWVLGVRHLDVPNMSASYYSVFVLPGKIARGDDEEAFHLAQEVIAWYREEEAQPHPERRYLPDYLAYPERSVARVFAAQGCYEEAIWIYRDLLATGYLDAEQTAEFQEQLAEWEAQLTRSQPASP